MTLITLIILIEFYGLAHFYPNMVMNKYNSKPRCYLSWLLLN